MKKASLLVVLLLQFAPATLQAAFYQWVDSGGVTHFTDNPDKIPERYREKVKKLDLRDEKAAPRAGEPRASAPAQAPAAAPGSYGGHPEEWWRERYTMLRTELKALQDGLVAKQAKLGELRRKRVIYMRAQDRQAVNSMNAEISVDELHISELQGKLEELERQATRAAVPLEWRQ